MSTQRSEAASPMVSAILVAVLGGALIAIQSMANGDLAVAGAGALVAGWVSYVGTVLTIVVVIAVRRRTASTLRILRDRGRLWWFAIGLSGIPLVLTSSYGVPIVGVAVAAVGSVAGQTVVGLILDSRGVGVPERIPLTGRRIAAALTALAGLALSMLAGSGSAGVSPGQSILIAALFFVSGGGLAIQNAGNGKVAQDSGDPVIAGFASASGGGVVISLILAIAAATGLLGHAFLPTAAGDWYRYLGGPLGAAIVISSAWAVRHLGTFALTLTVVGGQLVTAVVADAVRGLPVTWPTLASIAAIIVATMFGVTRGRPNASEDDASSKV